MKKNSVGSKDAGKAWGNVASDITIVMDIEQALLDAVGNIGWAIKILRSAEAKESEKDGTTDIEL